jgi:hypothetical protein
VTQILREYAQDDSKVKLNMTLRDDLNYGLAAFGIQIPDRVNLDEWAGKLADQPCRNTVGFVAAATVLFYLAERGRNPKVRDIYDSLIYCSTNISVGYSDIFARTPLGKLVGSALMTLGPSLAARTLDGPRTAEKSDATQQQILGTLEQILRVLQRPSSASPTVAATGSNGRE